ncbi:MAG: hypothetical protein KAR47_03785, partial [Planctomycetes bacterium]|nr:hypothetical protein [Planctomycetota bacterium]
MSVFERTASVFFVGGTGTKAGSAYAGGCTRAWYDANFSQLSDIMGANGAPLIAEAGCSYDEYDNRITKANAGEFDGVEVGMVAYISDGDVDISTDRYEITAVDPSGDWIEVSNIDASGNATGITVNIGGAFDSLQNASDYTDAGMRDVDIFTNKAETLSATLDLDTGWGNIYMNSHKRFEGFSLIPGDMRIGSANYQSPLEALMDGV